MKKLLITVICVVLLALTTGCSQGRKASVGIASNSPKEDSTSLSDSERTNVSDDEMVSCYLCGCKTAPSNTLIYGGEIEHFCDKCYEELSKMQSELAENGY